MYANEVSVGRPVGPLEDLGVQALLSLSDHRLRTFLSVPGIAIGIAAVILTGVVSQGGKQMVFSAGHARRQRHQ